MFGFISVCHWEGLMADLVTEWHFHLRSMNSILRFSDHQQIFHWVARLQRLCNTLGRKCFLLTENSYSWKNVSFSSVCVEINDVVPWTTGWRDGPRSGDISSEGRRGRRSHGRWSAGLLSAAAHSVLTSSRSRPAPPSVWSTGSESWRETTRLLSLYSLLPYNYSSGALCN